NGTQSYPTIAASGSATSTTPFNFTFSPSAVCGSTINFVLTVTFAESATSRVFNFTIGTGTPGTAMTFSYMGPPAAIPDNNSFGVSVPLTISGIPAAIKNIQFRIDGSSCTTTAGSTTVGINHTWVGDLIVELISPSGTKQNVIAALTNGQDNNNGNNFCNTVLDDSASTPVQGLLPAVAPFIGTFRPAFPLSKFAGESANGTWTLHVVDIAAGDTGSVRAWSLVITPATCCPILTVSPSTLPNGAAGIAYNQTITASGGTAPYTFSLTAGALPSGLTLSSAGALAGAPTTTGSASFTITAVDANGCVGSRAYSMNVTAGITSFTPDHGNTNTRVTINGVGFTGVSSVTFNGLAASFTFISDTQVRAIVPAGASTGPIGMTTPAGTTSSAINFTIVAQTTRTFVSTQGSDANPCIPTLPCRTFGRALDATFYGGEIIVLKSGGYGPVTIAKAITIVTPDGVYAGLVASAGGNGITINATPGDVITLKGLTLNGVGGGANGIQVSNGAAVELSNLVINGFTTGISASGAERVHVYDSLIRGSTVNGVDISATFVLMDQVRLEGNLQAIDAGEGARVVVRRSQIAGTGSGGGVMATSITGSAEVALERVSISNTGTALQAGASAQCIIRVSRSMITGNTVGVSTTGSGVIASLGNNTLDGNGTDGTFTPLTAK
ncbi:MAG TPA: proprotein convertase P-domain-containing protein, partial [Thermoanaerobaculia bacterium]